MVWVLYKNALPQWFGFEALTLYPFVLVAFSKDKTPEDTLKHEMTHVHQVSFGSSIPPQSNPNLP